MAQLFPDGANRDSAGYAMAGLLVALAVMGIAMSAALPVWSQAAKREREAELIFRGEQYARAIELYQRRFVGAYPPDIDTLVEQRFLRRAYTDPMTDDGEFRVVYFAQVSDLQQSAATAARPGEAVPDTTQSASPEPERIRFDDGERGGVVGVVSRSDETSLRVYNGRERYNEWAFVYLTTSTDAAGVGGGTGVAPSRQGPGGGADGVNRERFGLGAPDSRPVNRPVAAPPGR